MKILSGPQTRLLWIPRSRDVVRVPPSYPGLLLQIDMQLLPRRVHPDAERRARTSYKGEYKSALPPEQPIRIEGAAVVREGRICIYLNFRINLGNGCKYCAQCISDVAHVRVCDTENANPAEWKGIFLFTLDTQRENARPRCYYVEG